MTTKVLSLDHAQKIVERIKDRNHQFESQTRADILQLHEEEGWRALGYPSWYECLKAEFGYQERQVYHLWTAARIQRLLSACCTRVQQRELDFIPEYHLRPLSKLRIKTDSKVFPKPPAQFDVDALWEVWTKAVETAPDGNLTGEHVKSVTEDFLERRAEASLSPKKKHKPKRTVYRTIPSTTASEVERLFRNFLADVSEELEIDDDDIIRETLFLQLAAWKRIDNQYLIDTNFLEYEPAKLLNA